MTGLGRFQERHRSSRFSNHAQGAVGQEQYKNSIDPSNTHLSWSLYRQVYLLEDNQTDLQRQGDGYRKTGPLMTVWITNLCVSCRTHLPPGS